MHQVLIGVQADVLLVLLGADTHLDGGHVARVADSVELGQIYGVVSTGTVAARGLLLPIAHLVVGHARTPAAVPDVGSYLAAAGLRSVPQHRLAHLGGGERDRH